MAKIILPNDRGLGRTLKKLGQERYQQKLCFNWNRVLDVLEESDIEPLEFLIKLDGTVELVLPAITPQAAERMAMKLQKKAIPRSQFKFFGSNTFWNSGVGLNGQICTELVFQRRTQ